VVRNDHHKVGIVAWLPQAGVRIRCVSTYRELHTYINDKEIVSYGPIQVKGVSA